MMRQCHCCDDTGKVEGADGSMRPCSRCCEREFDRWYETRLTPEQRRQRSILAGVN